MASRSQASATNPWDGRKRSPSGHAYRIGGGGVAIALGFDLRQVDEVGQTARAVARRDQVVHDDGQDEQRHRELIPQNSTTNKRTTSVPVFSVKSLGRILFFSLGHFCWQKWHHKQHKRRRGSRPTGYPLVTSYTQETSGVATHKLPTSYPPVTHQLPIRYPSVTHQFTNDSIQNRLKSIE